jgi:hypothetical protein
MFQRISCSIRYISSSVIVACRCIGGSFAIEECGIRGIRAHPLEDVGAESSLKLRVFRKIRFTGFAFFDCLWNLIYG